MERGARLLVLAALTSALGACAASAGPVFATREQALAQAFPGARVERRVFTLTEPERKAVEQRARVKLGSRIVAAYGAWRGDTLVGTGFFDSRTVRTMPAVFLIVIAPDTTIARVDVLAFHEPPDYGPNARWLGTFERRKLGPGLWPNADIRSLSGATLTTRAVTESVRQALALYAQIVAPQWARKK